MDAAIEDNYRVRILSRAVAGHELAVWRESGQPQPLNQVEKLPDRRTEKCLQPLIKSVYGYFLYNSLWVSNGGGSGTKV